MESLTGRTGWPDAQSFMRAAHSLQVNIKEVMDPQPRFDFSSPKLEVIAH